MPGGTDEFDRLREEVALSHAAGRAVHFWWRDDDLIANSANFDRLIARSATFAAPLLVAIIPGLASGALDIGAADRALVYFCQHGWRHTNHRVDGPGKSEFGGDRDGVSVRAEIAEGAGILARLLGDRFMPVFVPPWNELDAVHLPALSACGLVGLSAYGPRPSAYAAPGIRLVNTHIDILRWNTPGGPQAVAAADVAHRLAHLIRQQRLEADATVPGEPIGILSHHRAMGDDAWARLDDILACINDMPGASWLSPPQAFAIGSADA